MSLVEQPEGATQCYLVRARETAMLFRSGFWVGVATAEPGGMGCLLHNNGLFADSAGSHYPMRA